MISKLGGGCTWIIRHLSILFIGIENTFCIYACYEIGMVFVKLQFVVTDNKLSKETHFIKFIKLLNKYYKSTEVKKKCSVDV